jgi:hypothetical protein
MKTLLQRLFSSSRNGTEPESDAWLEQTLTSLDPAQREPRYWFEFHRGVVLSAGAELARRRRLADVTVSDVVFSWSRALIPAAAVASLAAFLALRSVAVESPAPLTLEEILGETAAEVSASDVSSEVAGEISFTVDVY